MGARSPAVHALFLPKSPDIPFEHASRAPANPLHGAIVVAHGDTAHQIQSRIKISVLCASGMHSNSKERRSVADLLFLTDRRDTKQIGRQQRHHEQHVSQTACSTSFGSGIPLRPGVQRQLDSLAHDLVRADHLP